MGSIKWKRFRQVLLSGWRDAREISRYPDVTRSRISIFLDIWHCFRKYYLFSNQYKRKKFWMLSHNERISLAKELGMTNLEKDKWIDIHNDNWKFLSKYTSIKWEESSKKRKQRTLAYARHFGLSEKISVQYGVTFICEHYSVGTLVCGNNVLFARNVDVDYTGDLTIEDNVRLSEGVKILTHNHELDFGQRDSLTHGLIKTPLVIHDMVGIGARAIVMPGVEEIGRGAMISTGAVVRKRVPPYAIVAGNPSMVVGFRYTPAQILELEEELYLEEDRIPEEELVSNYKKYYLTRLQSIKEYLNN